MKHLIIDVFYNEYRWILYKSPVLLSTEFCQSQQYCGFVSAGERQTAQAGPKTKPRPAETVEMHRIDRFPRAGGIRGQSHLAWL
jgi:hypothetical protein